MNKIPNLPHYIFAFGALLWTLTYLGHPYMNLPKPLYVLLLIIGITAQLYGWFLIYKNGKKKRPHEN